MKQHLSWQTRKYGFNYQRPGCNSGTPTGVIKVTGKDFLKTDYTLDYTLFTVNNFAQTQPFGYFGLDVNDATQGQRIYIPQHGAGNPKELSIESDQDSNGLCQVNEANANGRGVGTDLGYYCDTIGGSSGSPVLAADTRDVIALQPPRWGVPTKALRSVKFGRKLHHTLITKCLSVTSL